MPLDNYKIVVDPLAFRDLSTLSKSNKPLSQKVIEIINGLAMEPMAGKSLKGDKKGCFSLRHGDLRIIYEIYRSQKIVHIIRIGHRKDVYR